MSGGRIIGTASGIRGLIRMRRRKCVKENPIPYEVVIFSACTLSSEFLGDREPFFRFSLRLDMGAWRCGENRD